MQQMCMTRTVSVILYRRQLFFRVMRGQGSTLMTLSMPVSFGPRLALLCGWDAKLLLSLCKQVRLCCRCSGC